jgi:hypothetical protein
MWLETRSNWSKLFLSMLQTCNKPYSRISSTDSVEFIGESCFEGCRKLVSVIFESNSRLVGIEESTFLGCCSMKSLGLHSCVSSKARLFVLRLLWFTWESGIRMWLQESSHWRKDPWLAFTPQSNRHSCVSWSNFSIIVVTTPQPVNVDIWNTLKASNFLHWSSWLSHFSR